MTSLRKHALPNIAEDLFLILAAVDVRYGRKPNMGVFHSFSALATLLPPAYSDACSALVLFDPPLCRPGATYDQFDEAAEETAALARRRVRRFRNRETLAEVLEFLPSMQRTVPGATELQSWTTLRESLDGNGFELCCPPDCEAQIIDFAVVNAASVSLGRLRCPAKVIGAAPTLPYSCLPAFNLRELLEVDCDFLPETSHIMQLEQPQACVDSMRAFFKEQDCL